MIKPPEIDETVWRVISAAASGDLVAMRQLLAENPERSRNGYFYTPPIHYAVREGHLEIVQMLLDAGADAEWNAFHAGSLIEMAKERGHDAIAALLEKRRIEHGRITQDEKRQDHEIHIAAENDDVRRIAELLDADPSLIRRGDRAGGSALHRAVVAGARHAARLLLDRGADIHALHSTGAGSGAGIGPEDVQPIDMAIWGDFGGLSRRRRPPPWRLAFYALRHMLWRRFVDSGPQPCDPEMTKMLIERGAANDLTIASARGDFARVRDILSTAPDEIRKSRPNGRRPLTTAIEFKHFDIARYLLEHGADPTWPENGAERGGALHEAARIGDRSLVELLLAHGADPNAHRDSAGNAVYAAKTREIRQLLESHGGSLDPYDLVWKDEDDEVMRRITADPKSAELGCGGVFTAVVTRQKRDLLKRLLEAGIRVPRYVTGCQSYLLEQPDMLKLLLQHGMHPDTCNWQGQTMLHMLCRQDPEGKQAAHNVSCATLLLEAGANISAREEEYASTPLGWAARCNNIGMVRFLLAHGAPPHLPDDKPWATPLAWAVRRGHSEVARILREAE